MKRNFHVHIRVSALELHALEKISRRESINPSEVLRLLIREECARRGMPISEVEFAEVGHEGNHE